MSKHSISRVVAVSACCWASAVGAHAQDAARGAALLTQARAAIGGAKELAGVRTLRVTGTFRRVFDGVDTEGDFEVFIELPDKYLRSEKTGTPGQPSIETIEALVGTEVRDAVRGGGGRSGANAGGDGSSPVEPGDDPAAARRDPAQGDVPPLEAAPAADAAPGPVAGPGPGSGADPAAQRRVRQADLSRLLLMWLLKSDVPPAWVGIAESPDGNANVLEARYADGGPTRLFLESKTHMPLMMQWEAAPAVGGGGGQRGAGRRGGGGGRRGAAPDAAGARQGGPPPLVTFDMTFSDHREVNGIRLPHVITRGTNGQTTERWTVSRYRINQPLGADTFTR